MALTGAPVRSVRPALVPVAAGAALLLTACQPAAPLLPSASPTAPSSSASATPPTPTAPPSPAPSPSPSAEPSGSAPASPADPSADPSPGAVTGVPGEVGTVLSDLDVPWGLALLPDGAALVTERGTGRVLRVTRGAAAVPLTFPGGGDAVPGLLAAGEGGLLGIETAPDGDVLLYHSTASDNRIVRYEYDVTAGALSDPRVLLSGIPAADTHNGGRIAIGPDGHLYAGTGDAQDTGASQDSDSLAGKILRITLDGDPAPGNPFPGSPVWSLGHRNVQGLGWTADGTMVAAEFGQNTWDELNVITPGANYGWPGVEGPGDGGGEFTAPAAVWSPSEASPSGLAVTADAVYVAALRGQRLWRVPVTGDGASPLGTPEAFLEGELGRLRDVAVTPEGTLWVLTNNTSRGTPRDGDDRIAEVALVDPAD